MQLPNADRAIVAESKVVDYLLSANHPGGRSKARFFSEFGFHTRQWAVLADALRQQGSIGEVTSIAKSCFGTKYSVDGLIETPDGRNPLIRTVWIKEAEGVSPRLITAHPLRRRHDA